MKACKKCKKQVANKAKICKYCGADVTKSKIIKKSSNIPTKNTKKGTKTNTKKPVKKVEEKVKVVVPEKVEEKEILKKDNVNKVEKKAKIEEKKISKKVEEVSKKDKDNVKVNKKVEKNFKAVFDKVKLIKKNKDNKKPSKKVKAKKNIDFKLVLDLLTKLKKFLAVSLKKIGSFLVNIVAWVLYGLSYGVEFVSKALNSLIDFIISLFILFGKNVKKYSILLKAKILALFVKRKAKNRIKKRNAKIAKINNQVRHEMREKENIIKAHETGEKHNRKLKPILITVFILGFFGGFAVLGLDVYKYFSGTGNSVVTVSQKATRDKVFTMRDVISYNDVDYRIMKVETSMGNSYKSPKEGNQFLIVTVYIRNNSSKKVSYSYENWTMSNSKGEEKKRFFSSINVDDALYSGQLVIGGIKTGSMVFEQPINDSKLRMNYYELKVDENGNEVLDQAKRVFSVSIKVPDNNKSDVKENTNTKEVDVKKGIS